jgi:PadR family transcriptional regulator
VAASSERLEHSGGGWPQLAGGVGPFGESGVVGAVELWRDSTVRAPFGTPASPGAAWAAAGAGEHQGRWVGAGWQVAADGVDHQRGQGELADAGVALDISAYLALLCMRLRDIEVRVHIDKDLVAASSTPLVLAILAEGESYGYAILKRVRELSGGELEWTDGMLYPLLHRLLRLGYVTTEWRTPPEGRRRRYYAITDDGRAALADQRRQWATVARALGDVWPGSGGPLTILGEA